MPDPLERGCARARCRDAARRALSAPPVERSSTPTTSRRSARACATRSRSCSTACPTGRAVTFRDARRRCVEPARGRSCASSRCSSCSSRASSTSSRSRTSATLDGAAPRGGRVALDHGEPRRLGRCEPRPRPARRPRAVVTGFGDTAFPEDDAATSTRRGARSRPSCSRRPSRSSRGSSRSSSSSRSREVEALCDELADEYEQRRTRLRARRASPAATGSRRIPTSRPTSSASCSKASTCGCPDRRSRRSRSSPTSSRSRAVRSRRSAA